MASSGFAHRPGLVPYSSKAAALQPWGVLGPMGRTVEDAHLLLLAQADVDKRDPFSSDDYARIPDALTGIDLASVRVAISADLGCAPVDTAIRKIFAERVATFRGAFAEAQDRDPDLGPHIHDVFEILRGLAFVSQHHDRLKNHRDKLGPNVLHHTEAGLKHSLADVAWAQVEQAKLMKSYMALFDEVDVLIAPAASVSPFPHSQWYPTEMDGKPMDNYMRWLAISYGITMGLTVSACIPCGVDHLACRSVSRSPAPMVRTPSCWRSRIRSSGIWRQTRPPRDRSRTSRNCRARDRRRRWHRTGSNK